MVRCSTTEEIDEVLLGPAAGRGSRTTSGYTTEMTNQRPLRTPRSDGETEKNSPPRRLAEAKATFADDDMCTSDLHGVSFDAVAVHDICRRHFISRLRVYGSILREDFGPESDVDLLVEFEPGHTPGWEFIDIQDDLAILLGRKVDLGTPAGLSKYIRERVLGEARTIYVRR
jgi:uncharacterized protein